METEGIDELEVGDTTLCLTRAALLLLVLCIVVQCRFLLEACLSLLKVVKVIGLTGLWFGVWRVNRMMCVADWIIIIIEDL